MRKHSFPVGAASSRDQNVGWALPHRKGMHRRGREVYSTKSSRHGVIAAHTTLPPAPAAHELGGRGVSSTKSSRHGVIAPLIV